LNWKGEVLLLLVGWILPGAATAALLLLFRDRWPEALARGRALRWAVPLWLLSRVVYVLVLYRLPGFEGGGDFRFCVEGARRVLGGEVPGRDFVNAYGPLFHHLNALGLLLAPGGHPAGTLLGFLLGDALVVLLGWRLGRRLLGEEGGAWAGTWLLLSPLLWHQTVVRAADESVVLATLLGAVLLLDSGRAVLGMAVLGLGFCATKVSFGPYAAAVGAVLWFHGRDRLAGLLSFLGTCALVFGAYAAAGGDPFQVIGYPGESLWFLNLSSPAFLLPVPWGRGAALAAYGAAVAWAAVRWSPPGRGGGFAWRAACALAAVHAISMLVQPFMTVNWVCQGLAFLLLVLGAARDRPLGRALLWLLPVLGFLVCVTSDTGEPLYRWAAAPIFLLVHAGLLALLLREPLPAVVGEEARGA